eukprot:3823973-Lingulodinium_polyedra.AAC.1
MAVDAAFLQQLWQDLPFNEAFTRKGDKVGTTRRFGWVLAWPAMDRTWHSRLAVLVWLGIQL